MPASIDSNDEQVLRLSLNILPEHVVRAEPLPLLHKDPFDRLLVAQAQIEPLTLVTADEQVDRYGGLIVCLA